MATSCTIDDCTRPQKAHGLCATHYMRQRRHGDTDTVMPAGRPITDERLLARMVLREDFGSPRTFERWFRGRRIMGCLVAYDLVTAEQATEYMETAIEIATRPNGTVNVSKYLQYITDLARTKGLWSDE